MTTQPNSDAPVVENQHPPLFVGIDLQSQEDEKDCPIVEGEACIQNDEPTLTVTPASTLEESSQPNDRLDWRLSGVESYLSQLSQRCDEEKRCALIAVDVPFGYPWNCRTYLDSPHKVDDIAASGPVDTLMYRKCELELIDILLRKSAWDESPERKPLWDHFEKLRRETFRTERRDETMTTAQLWKSKPLCTVGDWIARLIARWTHLRACLGMKPVGPSFVSLTQRVYLFECYPVATQISSGLWHPSLKGKEVCRKAAADMLTTCAVELGKSGTSGSADCRDFWGTVDLTRFDATSTDHRFDALTALLTAWWCGHSLGKIFELRSFQSYPRPSKVGLHPVCRSLAESTTEKTIYEGAIYYPTIPSVLLAS